MKNLFVIGAFLVISSAIAQNSYKVIGNSAFGCVSKDQFKALAKLKPAALKTGLAAAINKKQCVAFKKGEVVTSISSDFFAGLTQVQQKNSTVKYWTNSESLDFQ